MEKYVLDFEKDIPKLAENIDWLDGEEAKRQYVISFCSGKVNS